MMIADPAIRARWATWIAERLTRHADTDSGIEFELTRLAADGAWHRHLVDGGPGPQLYAIRRRLIEAKQPAGPSSCRESSRSRPTGHIAGPPRPNPPADPAPRRGPHRPPP